MAFPKEPGNPYRTMSTEEHYVIALTIENSIIHNPDAEFLEECVQALREEFSNVPEETMRSIFAYEYERRMKDKHLQYSKRGLQLYTQYLDGVEDPDFDGILLTTMAKELELSPALLARIILEAHFELDLEGLMTKDAILEMLKKPKTIPDLRLSAEVQGCLINDDYYGPDVDAIKHVVGDQFEWFLRVEGEKKGIRFVEEVGNRGEGFDKTPDLKLEDPVFVDGTAIYWIESKAMFADEELHQSYVIQQYARYHARFGPGLVIYWYGFVDTILFTTNVDIIISLDFPTDAISTEQKEEMDLLGRSVRPVRAR